jgi:hypothetical protein
MTESYTVIVNEEEENLTGSLLAYKLHKRIKIDYSEGSYKSFLLYAYT